MKQEQKQKIALMRYSAIAPLVAGLDQSYKNQTAFFESVSAKGIPGPDGRIRHFAPSTIERWYSNYNKFGFDALLPKGRSDAGSSRKCLPPPSSGSSPIMGPSPMGRYPNPQSAAS